MTMDLRKAMEADEGASQLLHSLRDLIQSARQRALRAVDAVQVQTCWEIGRHIVEFEQGGSARAEYGARLLQTLASSLAAEFGRGFDASNLRHMRVFYQAFPIRDALRPELSWTHYRMLLRVESDSARQWYMNEAAGQGWTTRSLERQISTLYYERLLATSDRPAVENEARGNLALSPTPRDFVRDPVMLEFLGLPGVGRLLEADLERALLDNLQAFLLELGRGFAFVARQYRISSESRHSGPLAKPAYAAPRHLSRRYSRQDAEIRTQDTPAKYQGICWRHICCSCLRFL
jgi:predicted nuclease of restriction endonuclease-like (RecB) superfamily